MTPKISVIIPVYNGEHFIGKAIRSVLAQEYPAHEIIVVDDGSKDGTPDLLEGFKDKVIVIRKENKGAAQARNAGILLSTGDYVAFLDADDEWFRHRLKKNVEYILKFPEIGFFCSNYVTRFSQLGRRLVRHYSVIPERRLLNYNEPLKRNPFKLLLGGNFAGTPSAVIVKKRLAEAGGLFRDNYRIVEDLGFFLEIATKTNFVIISDVLLYKRLHSANLSGQTLPMVLNHKTLIMDVMVSKKEYIESRHLTGDCARALARLNYWLGTLYFEAGQRKKAFSIYLEGLRSAPGILNLCEFLYAVFRKLIRMATGDILTSRKLNQHIFRKQKF